MNSWTEYYPTGYYHDKKKDNKVLLYIDANNTTHHIIKQGTNQHITEPKINQQQSHVGTTIPTQYETFLNENNFILLSFFLLLLFLIKR